MRSGSCFRGEQSLGLSVTLKETKAAGPDPHGCSVSSYLQQHGIPIPVTPKNPWSMDENLMHIR